MTQATARPRRAAPGRAAGPLDAVARVSADLGVRWRESGWAERWTRYAQLASDLAKPVVDRAATIAETVSPLGWTVLAGSALALASGVRLGWSELRIIGVTGLLLLALAALFTIGRTLLAVRLRVDPTRVVAGESSAIQVHVRNTARVALMPIGLEVPVGQSAARFTLPVLKPGDDVEELVVVPTERRGVIAVGPARTQRGDPLGLIRREVAWTDVTELFVHPRTVPLESLGAGLLRDLEGQTTNDVSMSDLAFHTLREYVPGDDRRYIHWRSSAKLSGAAGQGEFLVRQFLDTRRSHIAVVVDARAESYRDPEEFELAVSAGASISVRALADEMDLTIVCGEHSASTAATHVALDTFARADFAAQSLPHAVARLSVLSPDASTVVLVTGVETAFATFQQARAHLAPEVRLVALQVEPGAPIRLRETSGVTVIVIGELRDLPRALMGGVT